MIQTLEVQDLSCGACAETIRIGLDLAGFTSVKVSLMTHPHTVSAEVIDEEHLELLKSVLRGHGYSLIGDQAQALDKPAGDYA
ncbi:hypothetical protein JHD46_06995 [Sulfurimonas sp. SAG-AH-194-C20]|nr:cation transporter [Sulfurimonas sp. SAG-AH-194-C20]MDF1879380.1 hypothetical protein [Sulfurimonas sp. SAG-AH-194-C20]